MEGIPIYDGCAFTVSYPPELTTDGAGWFLRLEAANEEEGSVYAFIQARLRAEDEEDASLESLAREMSERFAYQTVEPTLEAATVQDYLGASLEAVRGEFVVDGHHYVILILVRPDTLLGDDVPQEVIHELGVQVSEGMWTEWATRLDILLQSFQPRDCGGV